MITINIMKSTIFIPKNIGIGPSVATKQPMTMRSYGSYTFYAGATHIKKRIISIGATIMYNPKGASSP
tara:strand:+ start:458 stop:661 length:204 start_codon:yes stop_codon:yes gene_type:complete